MSGCPAEPLHNVTLCAAADACEHTSTEAYWRCLRKNLLLRSNVPTRALDGGALAALDEVEASARHGQRGFVVMMQAGVGFGNSLGGTLPMGVMLALVLGRTALISWPDIGRNFAGSYPPLGDFVNADQSYYQRLWKSYDCACVSRDPETIDDRNPLGRCNRHAVEYHHTPEEEETELARFATSPPFLRVGIGANSLPRSDGARRCAARVLTERCALQPRCVAGAAYHIVLGRPSANLKRRLASVAAAADAELARDLDLDASAPTLPLLELGDRLTEPLADATPASRKDATTVGDGAGRPPTIAIGLHLRTYAYRVDGTEQGADERAVAATAKAFGACAATALTKIAKQHPDRRPLLYLATDEPAIRGDVAEALRGSGVPHTLTWQPNATIRHSRTFELKDSPGVEFRNADSGDALVADWWVLASNVQYLIGTGKSTFTNTAANYGCWRRAHAHTRGGLDWYWLAHTHNGGCDPQACQLHPNANAPARARGRSAHDELR